VKQSSSHTGPLQADLGLHCEFSFVGTPLDNCLGPPAELAPRYLLTRQRDSLTKQKSLSRKSAAQPAPRLEPNSGNHVELQNLPELD
jgi:hypothetical protein